MDFQNLTDCEGNRGTRRSLLAAGFATGLTLLCSRPGLSQISVRETPRDGPVLVVLFLRGGADALNIVAPYNDDDYRRARPNLAIKDPRRAGNGQDSALDLDGFFGFHPSLKSLHELYQEGECAVVHATGSGDETRSHFEAMGTMERGLFESSKGTNNGWLARHLLTTPERSAPLRSVSFTGTLPDSLNGALGPVALQKLDDFRLRSSSPAILAKLDRMYRGHDAVEVSGHRTLSVLRALESSSPTDYRPDNGATYPSTPLASGLRDVAYLVKKDIGLEVACLESLGWDTHVAQGAGTGWQSVLLKDLDEAVAAFFKDLGRLRQRVVVTIQSEFGRRVQENSGFGTDHGHGGAMMVMGGRVKGGQVYGSWPGLSADKLVGPGDLAVTTDYRTILAEVLESHLANSEIDKVFFGLPKQRVGLLP